MGKKSPSKPSRAAPKKKVSRVAKASPKDPHRPLRDKIARNVAKHLKVFMKKTGATGNGLAREIGLEPMTLHRIIKALHEPYASTLVLLADKLGTTLDALVTE